MYACLRLSPTIGVGQGRNILSGSTSETFHNRGGDINKDRDKKRCRQQKDKDNKTTGWVNQSDISFRAGDINKDNERTKTMKTQRQRK